MHKGSEKAQEKLLKKSHLEDTNWPHNSRVIPSQTGAKRPQDADAPATQEQKKSKKGEAVGDAPLDAVGLEQSDGESTGTAAQGLPNISAGETAAATGDGAFSSELLADVLCAALPTKVAMKDLVQAMKAKRIQAFKSVQLSSKADGGTYSNIEIAKRIAECKPDQVTNAEGLLSWIIKVRAVVTCV